MTLADQRAELIQKGLATKDGLVKYAIKEKKILVGNYYANKIKCEVHKYGLVGGSSTVQVFVTESDDKLVENFAGWQMIQFFELKNLVLSDDAFTVRTDIPAESFDSVLSEVQ